MICRTKKDFPVAACGPGSIFWTGVDLERERQGQIKTIQNLRLAFLGIHHLHTDTHIFEEV